MEIEGATLLRIISEANDIQLSTLGTAFQFREVNAAIYGLGDEIIIDGVLQDGYEDLDEIWTSTKDITTKTKLLVDVARAAVLRYGDTLDEENFPLAEKVVADNPRLIQICNQSYSERSRWLMSRKDQNGKADGNKLHNDYMEVRSEQLVNLCELGIVEDAIKLAEKYRDMEALVDIIESEMHDAAKVLESHQADQEEKTSAMKRFQRSENLVQAYFIKFGTAWANIYFPRHIESGRAASVLNHNANTNYQQHLTSFLRLRPDYAKLSWINEVTSNRNYAAAAQSLQEVQEVEQDVWSKKIEASISKLCSMAAKATGQKLNDSITRAIPATHHILKLINVQEQLYELFRPTLTGVIDSDAGTQLVVEQFCKRFVKGKPSLRKILEQNIQQVISRDMLGAEELADTLTLIDTDGSHSDDGSTASQRFFLALSLLKQASINEDRKLLQEKIIWRRCVTHDNWEKINRTELKSDTQVEVETGATALFTTLKEGFRHNLWDGGRPSLSPKDLLEAGTTIDSLQSSGRYQHMPENELDELSQDMEKEDALLENYLGSGRLGDWWEGMVEAARLSVRGEMDQKGEDQKRSREIERDFKLKLRNMDREAFGEPLSNSLSQDFEVDGQGDVMMEMG